jgi:protein EFR3
MARTNRVCEEAGWRSHGYVSLADSRPRNVQVTLQIFASLIEKAPRDLPLYAPYVLRILSIILRSRDITMVESSIPTFEVFCEHHDGASLSADQDYLNQYEEIVRTYASFASTRPPQVKGQISAPMAMRWRSVGLQAIKSVASSDALASLAGRQLDVIVPILLENVWTDNDDFLDTLDHRSSLEEKVDMEKASRRRTSISTALTAETAGDPNALALSGTTADADKLAEEDIGVLAIQCLKHIFVVHNRAQIRWATLATLKFIADRAAQREIVAGKSPDNDPANIWATRIYEMIARWIPVQDRYVILVTAMDTLVRSPLVEDNLQHQLVLAAMVGSLLRSDINLIGLSVMDVLLGLIQHVLRALQLSGVAPHMQQETGTGSPPESTPSGISPGAPVEVTMWATDVRKALLSRLQQCIGDLATHVYYADQISDMVSAILLRLKPFPLTGPANVAAAIEDPASANVAVASNADMREDPNTDGFFSFDTAKVKALESIKAILLVASNRKSIAGGSLGRNRVPLEVWEGTQWLLRDQDGNVRQAYVDALLTWLDNEMTRSDLRVYEQKSKGLTRSGRNDSTTSLTKRAISNASHIDKPSKSSRSMFLQLLHLAIYENALQHVDCEYDIVLLHVLLSHLVARLGVNAVRSGLPMVFRLQEDIMDAETPAAKIRMGSLCHGYFWTLSEKFDFGSSVVGRAISNEIYRRQSKMFWVNQISQPPIPLSQIGAPGRATPLQTLPPEELEMESLKPFDDRFQMVKLISLSYADSVASPPPSAPASPGRSFNSTTLTPEATIFDGHTLPEAVKDQMLSEWSKEAVIAVVQENSKTVSLSGSRSGTNTTAHRNFLAVNGNLNNDGASGGAPLPQGQHQSHPHRSRPNSTHGLGSLRKLRKDHEHSPSPPSESSRNSVTRVDQLKRVLSGGSRPGTRLTEAHSDGSSESMVSYDFSASEASFNTPSYAQQTFPQVERSASLRASNNRPRSKSRDRQTSPDERGLPLSSHPVVTGTSPDAEEKQEENVNDVPPVPPLPPSFAGERSASQDYAATDTLRQGRGSKRSTKDRREKQRSSGAADGAVTMDLESLLNGIETGDGAKVTGNVANPPY